jgi:hypothetical protein
MYCRFRATSLPDVRPRGVALKGIALKGVARNSGVELTEAICMPMEPNADCKALVDAVLPFARQMLDRFGEFYPYGAAMGADGKIAAVATHEGRERPPSIAVIRQLKAAFIAGAKDGRFKATALAYNVSVALPATGKQSDAIAVSLNHRDGSSVKVLFPYAIRPGGGAVIDEPFSQKGEADVFPLR